MRLTVWAVGVVLAVISPLAIAGDRGFYGAVDVGQSTFTDNGDGTVTDTTTGLMWMRCSMGQTWTGSTCSGTANNYTWDQANALTGTVSFAGQCDWYLPSLTELQSIIDTSYYPAINPTAFPNTPKWFFWSATHAGGPAPYYWGIFFGSGSASTGDNSASIHARLVRAGSNIGKACVVEFYKSDINHYFMTAYLDEAASLDNKPEWNWARTGKTFNVWPTQASAPSNASPVCRFFGVFANGTIGSHFYTVDADECANVKSRTDWGWNYEGDAFYAVKPTGSTCPSGTSPIYRAYNNGMGGAPNHRYLTSQADVAAMVAQGWVSEGTAFCGVQ